MFSWNKKEHLSLMERCSACALILVWCGQALMLG